MISSLKKVLSSLFTKLPILKKILPIVAVVIICAIIIFIGGPKKEKNEGAPLIPLVFQNNQTHLYGAVDTSRKTIINPDYKTLFAKELNGEYFFIGTTPSGETDVLTDEGQILAKVPSNYQQVSVLSLKDKLLEVSDKTNDLIGVINFNNNVIIPIKYTSLSFKNDFLILNPLSNESIANKEGKILVSANDYSSVKIQDNGIIVSNKKGQYGLINFNGEVVLPTEYENIHGVYGNVFAVQNPQTHANTLNGISNLYALYNISKKDMVTDFDYSYVQKEATESPFLACKVSDGISLYGYIDQRGSTIIPFDFQSGYGFDGQYAIVQENGVYGLMGRNGDFLIKPKFQIIPGSAYAIETFENGNYFVGYLNGKSYIMNYEGKEIDVIDGIVQTISHSTIFYQNADNKDFLYNLKTKKTTDAKLDLTPLNKGTVTPAGYFGAYKSVHSSLFANSMYLYQEGKGIISINGYNSIKFENGLFICHSQTRYDLLTPSGKVLLSFNPVDILNIRVTPDKLIYVQKLNPIIGNRMKSTVIEQQNTRLLSLYNIEGKPVNFKNKEVKKK